MDRLIKSPWDTNDEISTNAWEIFANYKKNKFHNLNSKKDFKNFETTINNVFDIVNNQTLKNILVFGYIQSGKTDFIIGTICKLFSNNKGMLIFAINQNNKSLLSQTICRTKTIYNKNIYEYKDVKNNVNEIIEKISNGENVLIFLLKHKSHLSIASNICIKLNEKNINYKSLLIDDEGDASSLENKSKKEDEISSNQTTIFKLINDIKTNGKSNYISITATPFAQYLLPLDDKLKPEYGFMLHPGYGYTGIQYFVNRYNTDQVSNFVKIEKVDKTNIDELKINSGFEEALKTYIVQCYWWTYIKNKNTKPRMLINMYKKTDMHDSIQESVNFVLKNIKDNFLKSKSYFNNILKNLQIDKIDINDFNSKVVLIIEKINAYILNGKSKDKVNLDESENNTYRIVIGHTLLDRGLTIVDLINTYISARSELHPNADVVLQQARFLGYRDEYKEMIRVFMTNELIEDYINIDFDIEYFRTTIENKISFDKILRFVPMDDSNNLKPTRSSVALFEYVNGSSKKELINNKYYYSDINNLLDSQNRYFYEMVSNAKSNEEDSRGHKIIKVNNWIDFINKLNLNCKTKDSIKKFLLRCCGDVNDYTDQSFISEIVDNNNLKIIIRILNQNIRKLTVNKSFNYHSIGKGNYSTNEAEFLFEDDTLCIDIIPINIYSEDINTLIYRTRIFIPNAFKQFSGYVGK